MRTLVLLLCIALAPALRAQNAQATTEASGNPVLRVILLGTAGGPVIRAGRTGIGTLVLAGDEVLLFDVGRNVPASLDATPVLAADVTRVFLTHLHSDHVVGLPELLLFPWASQARSEALQVWGPEGTRAMMEHLRQAFAYDIRIRRDIDERFPGEGIDVVATDIGEGVVYESNGVRVTAFLVDHAPIEPAFGYRVDYRGRSVVLSGDTRPSANLIRFARGTDLLVHEVGRSKQDPLFEGDPDEMLPNIRLTRGQLRTIASHHTDPDEAGKVFAQVKPRLAVFSHYTGGGPAILTAVQRSHAGPVEIGTEGMTIEIGDAVTVRRRAVE
jgi:ribonuclease Z